MTNEKTSARVAAIAARLMNKLSRIEKLSPTAVTYILIVVTVLVSMATLITRGAGDYATIRTYSVSVNSQLVTRAAMVNAGSAPMVATITMSEPSNGAVLDSQTATIQPGRGASADYRDLRCTSMFPACQMVVAVSLQSSARLAGSIAIQQGQIFTNQLPVVTSITVEQLQ
jgi:hypothetical protein